MSDSRNFLSKEAERLNQAMRHDKLIAHDRQRRELWAGVWIAVAGSEGCRDVITPTRYADEALEKFDERFGLKAIGGVHR